MLKFIKHHLDTISGIGIYPVISFLLFFGFFLAMLLWIRDVYKRQYQCRFRCTAGRYG